MLRFFTKKKPNPAVESLYNAAVAQARRPIFYQTFGVPDTLEGRFDMVIFHIWPLIDTLRDDNGGISPDGQALFDHYVHDMEQNLRAIGISDSSFPKKMKAVGKAFYGRFNAYRNAVGDNDALATAIARNVLGDEGLAGTPWAQALAGYGAAMRSAAAQAQNVLDRFDYPDPLPFEPDNTAAVAS
ncbi:MAG: ubiquinol-cytochrome C chaperone family protein [Pseudomonadota bacterium]